MNRRTFVKLAGSAAASAAWATPPKSEPLFDGKTLSGWTQVENNATSLSSAGINNPAAFVAKIAQGDDPISAWIQAHLDDAMKSGIKSYSPANADSKAVLSALVKNINQLLLGPSIFDEGRFHGIVMRPETEAMLGQDLHGWQLARLNKMLLEDVYPVEIPQSVTSGWMVKDGAMASTGSGRGVIYTAKDYARYRLTFTMRHVSGNPDHSACVLIFCTRPAPNQMPLDALAGIQFGVPGGSHWDYRPGMNNNGGTEYTQISKPAFDSHQWSMVEILADASKGEARMSVAQPVGSKAIEVLAFQQPAAGKTGPIALQMHNAGLFDEYKDLAIEVNP